MFLDVGGHLGQTLDEVLRPEYAFDRVHSFEPLAGSADRIARRFAGPIGEGRLVLHRVALTDQDGEATLYGDNSDGGASLFNQEPADGGTETRTLVKTRRATDIVTELIGDGDRAIMKLNCGGGEGAILSDLAASQAIHRLDRIMVDFALGGISGMEREPDRLMALIDEADYAGLMLAEAVMLGPNHQARIRNWLALVDRDVPLAADPAYLTGTGARAGAFGRLRRRIGGWIGSGR